PLDAARPESDDTESLARRVDEYLDEPHDRSPTAADCPGALLLALAVRAQRPKLTRRLWEHEVQYNDTDDELLHQGLESLARGRLLAGLLAYQRGDEAAALEKLAAVARLGRSASANSRLGVYVQHASELSQIIWQRTMHGTDRESHQCLDQ